jgi:subtilisin family serine protease
MRIKFGLSMNGQRTIISTVVIILSVLLISSTLTGAVYAHHKEGHSGGPPSNPGNGNGNGNDSFDSKAYYKQIREDRIQKNAEQFTKIKQEEIQKLEELGNPGEVNKLETKHSTDLKFLEDSYEIQKAQLMREQLKEIRLTKDISQVEQISKRHQKELENFDEEYKNRTIELEKKLVNNKIRILVNEFKGRLPDVSKWHLPEERLGQLNQEFKDHLRFLQQKFDVRQMVIEKLEVHTKEMKIELESQKEIKLQKLDDFGFSKIDPDLVEFLNSDDPIGDASKLGIELHDNEIKLVIKLKKFDTTTIADLDKLGTVEAQSEDYVQLSLKTGDITDLKRFTNVEEIRLPSYLSEYNPELTEFFESELQSIKTDVISQSEIRQVNQQTKSEGVYFINADIVHDAGITGNNVKVAVLDIAFNADNPKIVQNIVEMKSFGSKFSSSILQQSIDDNKIAHGTAVAEIITDVAPNVELFLYEMDSDVEFAAAVNQAIVQDIDIIAMAASWPNFSTDGTSHITKKVEEAIDNGITFVVPSGNFANKHWEGIFSDENDNGWNEFSLYDEGLTFSITKERLEKQKPIVVNLLWNDENFNVIDLDFALIDPTGKIVEYSAIQQKTNLDEQREQIYHLPDSEGLYSLGILNSDKIISNVVNVEIFSVNDELEHAVSKGSVTVPGDADGVIVVGAVNTHNGGLEYFSSQGPTNHGKLAPHIVGPDGVTTLAYNGELFHGTSATTPYVAGIAALLVDAEPDITNTKIFNKILQNTKQSEFDFISEYDNYVGYGLADASFIVGDLLNE